MDKEEETEELGIVWSEMKDDAERLTRKDMDEMSVKVLKLLVTSEDEIEQCFIMEGDSAMIAHRGEDGLVILLDCAVRRVALISVSDDEDQEDTDDGHLKLVD